MEPDQPAATCVCGERDAERHPDATDRVIVPSAADCPIHGVSAATPSWDGRWQENTCPICERTFTVTPSDDYFIPACGCYNNAEPGHYPCEPCGMSHVYACLDKGKPPERRFVAITDGERLVAQAEGKDAGDALLGEFFVRPEADRG